MDVVSLAPDGFGHWLAGLADGEGSFTITPNRPGFSCRFTLALRDDDSAAIQEIARRCGIGRTLLQRRPLTNSNRKPLALWRVERKAECAELVALFDAFPLRSKKARDFAIWREAVLAMNAMMGVVVRGQPRDWTEVAALKVRLSDVRKHPEHAGMAHGSSAGDRPG